jgi:hypothetical protein
MQQHIADILAAASKQHRIGLARDPIKGPKSGQDRKQSSSNVSFYSAP